MSIMHWDRKILQNERTKIVYQFSLGSSLASHCVLLNIFDRGLMKWVAVTWQCGHSTSCDMALKKYLALPPSRSIISLEQLLQQKRLSQQGKAASTSNLVRVPIWSVLTPVFCHGWWQERHSSSCLDLAFKHSKHIPYMKWFLLPMGVGIDLVGLYKWK